jgi:hypothetical protein
MVEYDPQQESLFEIATPAEIWDREATKRALDELFQNARQYRSSKTYLELMSFIARFRFYSPYNAMLIHIQMSGARFVAPGNRWAKRYGRQVKTDARPLVILQPMGAVMCVFDVGDTEPGENPLPLPPEIERPFEVRGGQPGNQLEKTIENAIRDGVRVLPRKEGSQSAGSITRVGNQNEQSQPFCMGKDDHGNKVFTYIPVLYDLLINDSLSRAARYATMIHELGHLYCGHLGSPNPKWWPDRRGLAHAAREFEAESVTYLICSRLGIDNPSDVYLSGYTQLNKEIPPISVECVMKAAGLIEQMGRERLKPRKQQGE